jgi:uncharacterized protein (TIGR02246 family)
MHPYRSAVLAMLILVLGSSLTFAKDSTSDEQAIRTLDTAWSQAAQARDLEKTVSYYADDASMLPPNMAIASGKDAIRAVWSKLLSMPGSVTFAPSKIVVAKSRDLAYEIGAFQIAGNDAQGKPAVSTGKFVVAWQKRSGQWKVVADIFNDDK